MERINRIIEHPLWLQNLQDIVRLEHNRQFCHHDIVHFLDVARLAYIDALEHGIPASKESIYAAALLHDIGRAKQYIDGTPHHLASAQLAEIILTDCGFAEKEEILAAITQHRSDGTASQGDLAGLIYRADKASRMCMFCEAQDGCNWSTEKKNLTLKA